MIIPEKELEILNSIYSSPAQVRQRDLAQKSGMSLGMTNAVLKRLVKKGFLMIRKVNNRNIQYVVSPEGIDEIARRSYRYLKRTIRNVARYKEAIEAGLTKARAEGYEAVMLLGKSDVDFMVEYLCRKLGLGYRAEQDPGKPEPKTLVLLAETWEGPPPEEPSLPLRRVLIG